MNDKEWAKFWLVLVGIVVGGILCLTAMDQLQVARMAGKQLCYSPVDRTNESPTWAWRKCQ